jgi:hypothetical protein
MATDGEIIRMWGGFSNMEQKEAAVQLYRHAEKAGGKDAIAAIEKELLSDATIEAAAKTFGLGRKSKAGTITLRAIFGEAIHIAKEKIGK